jgi:opacity protein-like surface antigen
MIKMKNILTAAFVATFAFAGAAAAEGFGFGGYGEYAMEAEEFEFGLHASYDVNALTFSAEAVLVKPNGDELDLDSVTLGVNYEANENADVYGKVAFDGDFDYEETTIGLAFKF